MDARASAPHSPVRRFTAAIEYTCDCFQSGVVRAGPEGWTVFEDLYVKACPFKVRNIEPFGRVAILIGFVSRGDADLFPYLRASAREFASLGICTRWERLRKRGAGATVDTFTIDLSGDLHMTKDNKHGKHPKMDDIQKNKDGKHDQKAIIQGVKHFLKLHEDEKLEIIPISETDSPDNPGFTRITFDRKIDDDA